MDISKKPVEIKGCFQGFYYVFGPKLLMLEILQKSSQHCVGWASGIS